MDLVQEIRQKFAHLSLGDNRSYKLETLNEAAEAWVLKIDGDYAVGVEIDTKKKVNEAFSNVSFYTNEFLINDTVRYLLILSTASSELRSEFAGIAAMFVEAGDKNKKRLELLSSPHKWWADWKDLLGNKNIDESVHGLIGELLFLFYLKQKNNKMSIKAWGGSSYSSHDFNINDQLFEVKTTLVRYSDVINISSQYQGTSNKESYLIFIKLERLESRNNIPNTYSIKSLLSLLTKQGFEYEELNNKVKKLGFLENSIDRDIEFELLEIRKYKIDENFPVIDIKDFINAQNIMQVNYKLSLSGLEYELLNEEFNSLLDV